MDNIFGGSPTDKPANVEAGTDAEAPVEQVDGGKPEQEERTYSGADLEKIVKDRLKREQKKLSSQYETRIQELESKMNPKKDSPNVEQDLRSKLSEYEKELKAREAKLSQYKDNNLRSMIEKKFASADCLDPELVVNDLLSRKLVHMDDDDEIVVENASNSLDDLVKDYLDKKPHLRRGTSQGGAGSKGPGRLVLGNQLDVANAKNWSAEDLKAYKVSQNITSNDGKSRLF